MNSNIIRELLKKYTGTILLLLFIAVATVLASVIAIEIGRRIINLISTPVSNVGDKQQQFIIYCLCLLTIAIISGVVDYGLNVMYSRFSQSFVRDIRIKLFNHLLQLPQIFFNKNSVGQITNKIMNEIGNIGSFFAQSFLNPIIHMFMIIFYGVYLFKLNWRLAIAGIIFIPLCVIILPKFNRRIQTLTNENINSSGNLTDYFHEVFTGISDIRASQTYFFEQSRLKKKIGELININLNMAKVTAAMESLMITITQLAPLSLYFYGGILCLKGEIAVGTLVASIVVINNLFNPVNSIAKFIMESRQIGARFDTIDEYFRLESETGIFPSDERKVASIGDIKFDKVKFGFTEDQVLLNDINFVTEYGKKVAFVGPSGSGKSLTATLLGTIYKPLSGNIAIGGRMTDSIPLNDLRAEIGYVNQTPFLFNDTIKNNIIYALLRKPNGNNDNIETWVDFSLLGNIRNMEILDQRILDIVKEVGLFEDVTNIGLRSKLASEAFEITESDKTKIVNARAELTKEITHYNSEYVEFYREDKFLEYCTIFENIVFCPTEAITEKFGSIRQFCKEHLHDYLKGKSLLENLFIVGLKLVRADNMLQEKLYKDKSPLLDCIKLDPKQIRDRININEKLTTLGIDTYTGVEKIDPSLVEEILDLSFNHCPGKSKEHVLDEKMRNEILDLRMDVKRLLLEKLDRDITFYDYTVFNKSLSLMENIIFGTINPLRKKANEDINALIRKLLKEAELEGLVIKRGLEFNVGERGSKLSGGQRQKVVIARILLKNPSILILDEATAALDAASQARINDLVAEKYKDKTVISIAHRLNIIKDYDEILVFDKGRIVEQGTFEDLIKMDGLFSKLYHGSN